MRQSQAMQLWWIWILTSPNQLLKDLSILHRETHVRRFKIMTMKTTRISKGTSLHSFITTNQTLKLNMFKKFGMNNRHLSAYQCRDSFTKSVLHSYRVHRLEASKVHYFPITFHDPLGKVSSILLLGYASQKCLWICTFKRISNKIPFEKK